MCCRSKSVKKQIKSIKAGKKIIFNDDKIYKLNDKGQRCRFFASEDDEFKILTVKDAHNESHFGRDRCFNGIRYLYYSVSKAEVYNIVKLCIQYQVSKLIASKA